MQKQLLTVRNIYFNMQIPRYLQNYFFHF